MDFKNTKEHVLNTLQLIDSDIFSIIYKKGYSNNLKKRDIETYYLACNNVNFSENHYCSNKHVLLLLRTISFNLIKINDRYYLIEI